MEDACDLREEKSVILMIVICSFLLVVNSDHGEEGQKNFNYKNHTDVRDTCMGI